MTKLAEKGTGKVWYVYESLQLQEEVINSTHSEINHFKNNIECTFISPKSTKVLSTKIDHHMKSMVINNYLPQIHQTPQLRVHYATCLKLHDIQ